MSVEKHIGRTRRAIIFWRLMGDIVSMPKMILRALADCFQSVETTIFLLGLDAARRYKAATGVDLGLASGDDDRYAGTDRELNERARVERLDEYEATDDE